MLLFYSQSAAESCHNQTVTNRIQTLCHGYRACRFFFIHHLFFFDDFFVIPQFHSISLSCSFTADPLTLSVSACLGLHLTLKTTFACVDKSVFQPKFVDRLTTTTTTTTQPTTSTRPTTTTTRPTRQSLPGWKEFSTGFWDPDEEEHLGVQAKPLEPKPISGEEPAHVIHIDHAEDGGGEDAANFAKVIKTKSISRQTKTEKRKSGRKKCKLLADWSVFKLYIVSRMASLFRNWTSLTELPPSRQGAKLNHQNILPEAKLC